MFDSLFIFIEFEDIGLSVISFHLEVCTFFRQENNFQSPDIKLQNIIQSLEGLLNVDFWIAILWNQD